MGEMAHVSARRAPDAPYVITTSVGGEAKADTREGAEFVARMLLHHHPDATTAEIRHRGRLFARARHDPVTGFVVIV
jgi:hypothetical protein